MFEIRKWEPMRELSTIQRELDDFFRRAFGSLTPGLFKEGWHPAVNCFMKENKFYVQADLPGIDPKDIEISITGNLLTIKGERKAELKEEKEEYLFHESSYGRFERTLTIPEGVETDKVHASFKKGVLELTMPAKRAALPKKIKVEVEETKESEKAA